MEISSFGSYQLVKRNFIACQIKYKFQQWPNALQVAKIPKCFFGLAAPVLMMNDIKRLQRHFQKSSIISKLILRYKAMKNLAQVILLEELEMNFYFKCRRWAISKY